MTNNCKEFNRCRRGFNYLVSSGSRPGRLRIFSEGTLRFRFVPFWHRFLRGKPLSFLNRDAAAAAAAVAAVVAVETAAE